MSISHQRARIARVRRIQHDLAALAAAKASGHVQMLETNQQRLKAMREGLASAPGITSGASLSSRGELAMRLETARDGLGRTIDGARAAAALREKARIGARRDQESADKLQQKALTATLRNQDRRNAALFRPRIKVRIDGDDA
jgi:hypothetical protein